MWVAGDAGSAPGFAPKRSKNVIPVHRKPDDEKISLDKVSV